MATVRTKFDVGPRVWIAINGAKEVTINKITVLIFNGCDSITYEIFGSNFHKEYALESEIFSTKQELIKSL